MVNAGSVSRTTEDTHGPVQPLAPGGELRARLADGGTVPQRRDAMRVCIECSASLTQGPKESPERFAARCTCGMDCYRIYLRRRALNGAAERFRSFIIPEPMSGCWLWTGVTTPDRYGLFRLAGRRERAHRFAWEMEHGAIPGAMFVCHRCDTPPCVNPAHLFLGTNSDNMLDCSRKGRLVDNSGERHGHSRLTWAAIRDIRSLVGTATQSVLAARFGVSRGTISDVACGRTWCAQ
jgi:hypothetical protein